MVFVFGMIFPSGIALYWVTQSLFMIIQQFIVVGWGGFKVPPWFPGAGRVTALSFPPPPTAAPSAALAKPSSNGRARGEAAPPARGGAAGQQQRRPAGASQSRSGGGARRNKRSR
jgi:hypothetical protein